ncbi:hypothetical protein P8452_51880 [Trifolium repens]|nr:hypothetical protein P8452_51880 [Trifolium repens]
MARVLGFYFTLVIFLSLFLAATSQTEEVFPCLFTLDCPTTFTCPPKFIPKCINLKCQCHFDKEPKEDF